MLDLKVKKFRPLPNIKMLVKYQARLQKFFSVQFLI